MKKLRKVRVTVVVGDDRTNDDFFTVNTDTEILNVLQDHTFIRLMQDESFTYPILIAVKDITSIAFDRSDDEEAKS